MRAQEFTHVALKAGDKKRLQREPWGVSGVQNDTCGPGTLQTVQHDVPTKLSKQRLVLKEDRKNAKNANTLALQGTSVQKTGEVGLGRAAADRVAGSLGSTPRSAVRSAAASATLRAIGPAVS